MGTKLLKISKNSASNVTGFPGIEETHRIRILFFIGTLRFGGKERRLVELLKYLKKKDTYELLVVLAFNQIDFDTFYELNIRHIILDKQPKLKDPKVFLKLDQIVKEFQPHIIHTWGRMQTFYMIPTSMLRRVPIVNSQITNAKPAGKVWSLWRFVNTINFIFADVVLANSYAGLRAYRVNDKKKSKVIYNGVDLARFQNLPDPAQVKKKYHIDTKYAVVMVASFTSSKDYQLFYEIAKLVHNQRQDVTFIGAGGPYKNPSEFERMSSLVKNNTRILFPGNIDDVEALVNACDIGVLFTNNNVHGEGISNAIIEYMALGKPVIANDTGGTCEVVRDHETGYLVSGQPKAKIAEIIMDLMDHSEKRMKLGKRANQVIQGAFSLETMGNQFEHLYKEVLGK